MSDNDNSFGKSLAILASIATIIGVVIAAIALVPAFGQWLYPHSSNSTPINQTTNQNSPATNIDVSQSPQWVKELIKYPIVPGSSLAGIEIGFSENKVLERLGETPMEVKTMSGEHLLFRSLRYTDDTLQLDVSIDVDTQIVSSIRLQDINYNQGGFIPAINGITIGNTESQMIGVFGQPDFSYEGTYGNEDFISYSYNGFEFWARPKNKLIYSLTISAP